MALWEGRVMDAQLGMQLNPGFGDYNLPGSLEMPEMVPIIDDEDKREAVIGIAERHHSGAGRPDKRCVQCLRSARA